MPDELPRTGLGRRIADPNEAAEISEADVDTAIAQWRKDAPKGLANLLDAETENEDKPIDRI